VIALRLLIGIPKHHPADALYWYCRLLIFGVLAFMVLGCTGNLDVIAGRILLHRVDYAAIQLAIAWITVAAFYHGYDFLTDAPLPPPQPNYSQARTPPPRPPPPPPIEPNVFPLLGLRTPFTRAEVVTAFRRQSMKLHPDHGGNAGLFRMLLAERERASAIAVNGG
jgi:hypothetical protein